MYAECVQVFYTTKDAWVSRYTKGYLLPWISVFNFYLFSWSVAYFNHDHNLRLAITLAFPICWPWRVQQCPGIWSFCAVCFKLSELFGSTATGFHGLFCSWGKNDAKQNNPKQKHINRLLLTPTVLTSTSVVFVTQTFLSLTNVWLKSRVLKYIF